MSLGSTSDPWKRRSPIWVRSCWSSRSRASLESRISGETYELQPVRHQNLRHQGSKATSLPSPVCSAAMSKASCHLSRPKILTSTSSPGSMPASNILTNCVISSRVYISLPFSIILSAMTFHSDTLKSTKPTTAVSVRQSEPRMGTHSG